MNSFLFLILPFFIAYYAEITVALPIDKVAPIDPPRDGEQKEFIMSFGIPKTEETMEINEQQLKISEKWLQPDESNETDSPFGWRADDDGNYETTTKIETTTKSSTSNSTTTMKNVNKCQNGEQQCPMCCFRVVNVTDEYCWLCSESEIKMPNNYEETTTTPSTSSSTSTTASTLSSTAAIPAGRRPVVEVEPDQIAEPETEKPPPPCDSVDDDFDLCPSEDQMTS